MAPLTASTFYCCQRWCGLCPWKKESVYFSFPRLYVGNVECRYAHTRWYVSRDPEGCTLYEGYLLMYAICVRGEADNQIDTIAHKSAFDWQQV